MPLELSAPKNVTFIVSVVLALVAVVVHFANVDLPISPTQGFVILLLLFGACCRQRHAWTVGQGAEKAEGTPGA
jgi:hypothetical protein